MRTFTKLVVTCLLFSACSPSEPGPTTSVVRDSLGIRIVENSPQALEEVPEWHLSSTPILRLGSVDGPDPLQFYGVTGAVVLQDRIWVLNRGSSELRAFRRDGSHALSTGRHGEGPGEFTFALDLSVIEPDTLVVWDRGTKRISFFSADGVFRRSAPVLMSFQNPGMLGAFEDGSLLFRDSRGSFLTAGGIEEDPFIILRIAPDGTLVDSLGVYPGGQRKRMDGPPGSTEVVYAPATRAAGGRELFWLGTGEAPQLEERTPSGEVVQIVRWHEPDRSVTQEHVDAYKSQFSGITDPPPSLAMLIRRVEHAPFADQFPALSEIVLDRVGGVWVKRYRRPKEDGPDQWLVFDPNGELAARVQTPPKLRVYEIGEDFLLGVTTGEFGEEYVLLFDLVRSAADG